MAAVQNTRCSAGEAPNTCGARTRHACPQPLPGLRTWRTAARGGCCRWRTALRGHPCRPAGGTAPLREVGMGWGVSSCINKSRTRDPSALAGPAALGFLCTPSCTPPTHHASCVVYPPAIDGAGAAALQCCRVARCAAVPREVGARARPPAQRHVSHSCPQAGAGGVDPQPQRCHICVNARLALLLSSQHLVAVLAIAACRDGQQGCVGRCWRLQVTISRALFPKAALPPVCGAPPPHSGTTMARVPTHAPTHLTTPSTTSRPLAALAAGRKRAPPLSPPHASRLLAGGLPAHRPVLLLHGPPTGPPPGQ